MSNFLDGNDYDLLRHAAVYNASEADVDRPVRYTRATEAIEAGQPLRLGPGGATVAATRVHGLAVNRANPGEVVKYKTAGFVYLKDWRDIAGTEHLTPGATYFLDSPGQLRTAPPASGYVVEVGEAHTRSILNVRLGVFVKL